MREERKLEDSEECRLKEWIGRRKEGKEERVKIDEDEEIVNDDNKGSGKVEEWVKRDKNEEIERWIKGDERKNYTIMKRVYREKKKIERMR